MSKKIFLIALAIISVISLAYLVIADVATFLKPVNNEIITTSTYNFNVTLDANTFNSTVSKIYFNDVYLCTIYNYTVEPAPLGFGGSCDLTGKSGIYTVNASFYNGTEDANITTSIVSTGVTVDFTAPTSTLYSPANNAWKNVLAVAFTCTSADNVALKNITIVIVNSTTNEKVDYADISGTSNSSSWSYNLSNNSIYTWNCLVKDDVGFSSWASNNNTLKVDGTIPTITSTSVTEGQEFEIDDAITCTCTATDNMDSAPTCERNGGSSCSTGSAGNRSLKFRATDAAGNTRDLWINFTIRAAGGGSSGGSSGGSEQGGGGETPTGDTGATSKEHCWDSIAGGVETNYDVDDPDIGIYKITIIPKTNLTNACLNVKQVINIASASVTAYSDSNKVYKYFKVTPTGISEADLTNVIIEFSVSKTWLASHKEETIRLNRYKSGWSALSTEKGENTVNYVYFSATSPGFSDFVITGDSVSLGGSQGGTGGASCGNAKCDAGENSTNCCKDCGCEKGFECKNETCVKAAPKFFLAEWFSSITSKLKLDWLKNKFWFGWQLWIWIIIAVVIVAATVLIIIFRKKIHFPFQINFSIKKRKSFGFE